MLGRLAHAAEALGNMPGQTVQPAAAYALLAAALKQLGVANRRRRPEGADHAMQPYCVGLHASSA